MAGFSRITTIPDSRWYNVLDLGSHDLDLRADEEGEPAADTLGLRILFIRIHSDQRATKGLCCVCIHQINTRRGKSVSFKEITNYSVVLAEYLWACAEAAKQGRRRGSTASRWITGDLQALDTTRQRHGDRCRMTKLGRKTPR